MKKHYKSKWQEFNLENRGLRRDCHFQVEEESILCMTVSMVMHEHQWTSSHNLPVGKVQFDVRQDCLMVRNTRRWHGLHWNRISILY